MGLACLAAGEALPAAAPAAPEAAAAAPGAQQEGGGAAQSQAHAATRRGAGPAPADPPLLIAGNHIQRPQRLRKLSEDQQKIRRKVTPCRPWCSSIVLVKLNPHCASMDSYLQSCGAVHASQSATLLQKLLTPSKRRASHEDLNNAENIS